MRLRRLRHDGDEVIAVERNGGWWRIGSDIDMIDVLGAPAEEQARLAREATDAAEGTPILPFEPRSLRCFSGWQAHWEQAARVLARRNVAVAGPAISIFERVTRSTFPPLRPGGLFFSQPVYYTGNHLTIVADGTEISWPPYSSLMDFELELGWVITRGLRDATVEEAAAAIGGFTVFNDLSARDTQWEEHRSSSFGPVVKTKTFASAMGADVVTADEVPGDLAGLVGSVVVDGELWATPRTDGLAWTPAQMVAHASQGEQLHPGEYFTSGTLPTGAGLELNRFLVDGSTVALAVEGIGSVTNRVVAGS